MSKRVSQDTSNTVDTNEVLKVKQDKEFQSISEVSEQSIIMILCASTYNNIEPANYRKTSLIRFSNLVCNYNFLTEE